MSTHVKASKLSRCSYPKLEELKHNGPRCTHQHEDPTREHKRETYVDVGGLLIQKDPVRKVTLKMKAHLLGNLIR